MRTVKQCQDVLCIHIKLSFALHIIWNAKLISIWMHNSSLHGLAVCDGLERDLAYPISQQQQRGWPFASTIFWLKYRLVHRGCVVFFHAA